MSKRYMVIMVVVLVVVVIGALVYSSVLQSSTQSTFQQQRVIETQNAMFDLTATASKQQP